MTMTLDDFLKQTNEAASAQFPDVCFSIIAVESDDVAKENVITVSSNMSGEEFMVTLDTLVADPPQLLGAGEFADDDDADDHEPSTEARLN